MTRPCGLFNNYAKNYFWIKEFLLFGCIFNHNINQKTLTKYKENYLLKILIIS